MLKTTSDPHKVNVVLESAIEALLTDRPVAYHPVLARAVKSVPGAVLLSQLLYWQPRCKDPAGWFWKTRRDIYLETGLNRTEQEEARIALVNCGVLEEQKRGVPARMHFRVDIKMVAQLLSATKEYSEGEENKGRPRHKQERKNKALASSPQLVGNPPTGWRGIHQHGGCNATNYYRDYSRKYTREYIFESNRRRHAKRGERRDGAGLGEGSWCATE